jgi:3-hydroxyacyl-CoA dehydrogenase/enoyl-CoA hydratase/3-hydroxybutyryl-CoA epimerase
MAYFQAESLWINQMADGVAVVVFDLADHKVNVLNEQVFADLEQALNRIVAGGFKLLLIRSGKPGNFCAGADVHQFEKAHTPEDFAALSERGQKLFARLAQLPVPSVAVVAGACLGGGLELAMACDYRVAVDRPETRFGLPEIELGLIPGWGGTQRLPRLVGLERALQVILGSRRLGAREAVEWGLADELAKDAGDEPPAFLAEPRKRQPAEWPRRTWRQTILESNALGQSLIYRGAGRLLRRRLPDDMPAPAHALEAVRVGIRDGMEAGLALERAAIARLASTSACRNLVRIFLRREQARKGIDKDAVAIRRVGIVGAGAMGAAIAQLAVLKGYEIVVREATEEALGMGMLRLVGMLQKAVESGALAPGDLERRLAAIKGTTAWKGFDAVDLIIEAIPEDLEQKRALFRAMEENTPSSTILASNTSSLRIQDLQDGLRHPERVAGLHFFNPVHRMPLVEVVAAPATETPVLGRLKAWTAAIGKTPLIIKDSPGFVVNRVLIPYLNEAVLLVSEGLDIERVDQAMHKFGMPMGPLEVLDHVGLDVAQLIARVARPVFGDRLGPQAGFELLVSRGWLGQKSRIGFYRYHGRRKRANRLAQSALRVHTATAQLEPMSIADQQTVVQERLVGLMVNEAARCLGEQLVDDADTIDLAMVLGSGWAPHRGGPLRYARDCGPGKIVQILEKWAARRGDRYQPCVELRNMAIGDR